MAIGVPVDYFQWQDWGHVLGLFVLFRIVVASTMERRRPLMIRVFDVADQIADDF